MLRKLLLICVFSAPLLGDNSSLEEWLATRFPDKEGVAIGVVYQDQLIWTYPTGFAFHEKKIPVTQQTIFRIASLTKIFSAIAILQLAEKRRLSLDDPVEKHLRWFRMHSYSNKRSMTIRDLLTHSAGLQREPYYVYGKMKRGYPSKVDLQRHLPFEAMSHKPGEALIYSNLGYVILGWIIEKVSGLPYSSYLQRQIFRPLGMKNTHCKPPKRLHSSYAWGYQDGKRVRNCHIQTKGMTSAFGLYSNLQDLSKVVTLLLGSSNKKILKKKSLDKMVRPQFKRNNLGWSLGLCHYCKNGNCLLVHAGNLEGFVSFLALDPLEELGVILLANDDRVKASHTALHVLHHFKEVPPSERDKEMIRPSHTPAPSQEAKRPLRGGSRRGSSSRKGQGPNRKAPPGASSSSKSTSYSPGAHRNNRTYKGYGKKPADQKRRAARSSPSRGGSAKSAKDRKRSAKDRAANQARKSSEEIQAARRHKQGAARGFVPRKAPAAG